MSKFWSITTTIRNPERFDIKAIKILKEFDGQSYSKKKPEEKWQFQSLFFIKSFQRKWYGYGSPQFTNPLISKYKKLMKDSEEGDYDLSFEQAKEILLWKKKVQGVYTSVDEANRGRQFYNPFRKAFLCWFDDWSDENLVIFRVHPNAEELISNKSIYFRHTLSLTFQYPDLANRQYKKEDGYNIRPLIATLSLIKEVNKLCLLNDRRPRGISRYEFEMFCITMTHADQIEGRASKILRFRDDLKIIKNQEKRAFIKKRFSIENSSSYTFKNSAEFGDNVLRNFRLTNFLSEKRHGNYHYINLNNEYLNEIDKIIEFYGTKATILDSSKEQMKYFTNPNNSIILDKNTLIKEIFYLIKKYPNLKSENLNKLSPIELLDLKEKLIVDIKNMHIKQIRKNLINDKEKSLKNILEILEGDYTFTPEALEYETSRALMCLANKESTIKPNYRADENGYPMSHARANVPDIECYMQDYNLICEVTKLTTRDQWHMESVPIARHLNTFQHENSFLLFL